MTTKTIYLPTVYVDEVTGEIRMNEEIKHDRTGKFITPTL